MARQRPLSVEIARIVAPILILAVAIGGFMLLKSMKEKPAGAKETGDGIPEVETEMVRLQEGGLNIEVSGLVVPFREITVAAEVAGKIDEKVDECRAGNYVQQGTKLIQIDSSDYDFEVKRLSKERDQAKTTREELTNEIDGTLALLQIAGQQVASLEREYERKVGLGRTISPSEIDATQRDVLAAKNSELTLRNQLTLLRTREVRLADALDVIETALLPKALKDQERTIVKSPVSGVIVEEMIQEGEFVQRGTPLFSMEDTSQVEVICNLRKEDVRWLWLSQSQLRDPAAESDIGSAYRLPEADATVFFNLADVQYTWEGRLKRFDGIGLDERTRTIACRVVVQNPRKVKVNGASNEVLTRAGPRALVRGMYVTVQIHAVPKLQLLRISKRALRPGDFLWTVRDGTLKRHDVQVAQSSDGEVVVYSVNADVSPGDFVVVSPLNFAQDGMTVRESRGP